MASAKRKLMRRVGTWDCKEGAGASLRAAEEFLMGNKLSLNTLRTQFETFREAYVDCTGTSNVDAMTEKTLSDLPPFVYRLTRGDVVMMLKASAKRKEQGQCGFTSPALVQALVLSQAWTPEPATSLRAHADLIQDALQTAGASDEVAETVLKAVLARPACNRPDSTPNRHGHSQGVVCPAAMEFTEEYAAGRRGYWPVVERKREFASKDGLGSRLLSAGRLALSDESLDLMVSWNSVKIDADPRRRQRHRQSAVFTISFGGAPSRSAQDACVREVTEADPEFFDASVRTLVRGVEDPYLESRAVQVRLRIIRQFILACRAQATLGLHASYDHMSGEAQRTLRDLSVGETLGLLKELDFSLRSWLFRIQLSRKLYRASRV